MGDGEGMLPHVGVHAQTRGSQRRNIEDTCHEPNSLLIPDGSSNLKAIFD
jgi:hypothetical protein